MPREKATGVKKKKGTAVTGYKSGRKNKVKEVQKQTTLVANETEEELHVYTSPTNEPGSHTEKVKESIRDPFPDLTREHRVVLYTLFLIFDYGDVCVDDDVTMGDIDVRRTLSELKERGLVIGDGHNVHINRDLYTEIVRSYVENCLLSDIDRDFYLQVASRRSLVLYTEEYLRSPRDREQPGDIPLTFMRLLMEGRERDLLLIDLTTDNPVISSKGSRRCDWSAEDAYSSMAPDPTFAFVGECREYWHPDFADWEFQNFIKDWCRLKNVDPMTWADKITFEEAVRVLSAYTILYRFEKGFAELVFDHKKWSILISILMSKNYTISVNDLWEERLKKIHETFPSLRESNHDMCTTEAVELVEDLVYNYEVLTVNGNVRSGTVEFVSNNVRDQVMGHFVLNCLKTDEDYNNYLNLSSVDSLLEYVRTWWYKSWGNEECLYLPERMEEFFIRKLGIDAIRHVMVGRRKDRDNKTRYYTRRKTVSKILNVPKEIFDWNYAARSRYAECVKKGTQTIHRARAMLVGCAGAGKTTLLKRLQKRSLKELKKIQSTVGLEVHEDIFEITPEADCLKDVPVDANKEGKQLLSILDFAGQCAYYACHQVYLSRRAFYLLVIDMSKTFYEKVDPSICEQEGTMFMDWSYGEYMLFWLKSIHTYCDNDAPVIIVGTHLDQTKEQDSDMLYNSILDYLEFDKQLRTHLDRKRCFVLGFRSDGSLFQDTLSDLEKCIVSIAAEDWWKETIPTDWAFSEAVLRELRRKKLRMTSVAEFTSKCFGEVKEKCTQMKDILKFYHDIGVLLHFDESSLAETVIIDIQWFVDSFKNIITDPNQVRDIVDNNRDWISFYKSGHIQDNLLTTIWDSQHFKTSHEMDLWDRDDSKAYLLQYMQRLGLIATGKCTHYIPCMNKRTFAMKEENFFQSIQSKTSVLVLRFQFLPYFFYCRLIVACMTKTNGEWTVLEDNGLCLYKNVACFLYKRHAVALTVNRYSIQLQVFLPSRGSIAKDVTLEIRDNIEKLLDGLTGNFHKKVMYTVGYQCSKQEVFREHDDYFIEEREIYGKGKIPCPKHGFLNHHTLSESALLGYWKQNVLAEKADLDVLLDGDECTTLTEPQLKKLHFKTFDKLTKIGRDALQIYFDRIFPPVDLAYVLLNHEQSLRHGQYKFDSDQCTLLFRADRSIPSSADFDVTIMYKLLRNYGPNLPTPTNGWGKKPDIGHILPTEDVERIRVYRNEVEHKTTTTSVMEKDEFRLKWEDLSQAIIRLSNGSLKKDVNVLIQQR